jgi:hypothetical protein
LLDLLSSTAYDAYLMDEKKIKDRISVLIDLATDGPVSIETCGQVVQGAASLITLLYGPRSTQLAVFESALAEERKRIEKHWHESQPASIAEMVAGVLRNVSAELDVGLVGSLRQQVAGEVLADFLSLSRKTLEEAGDQPKNVAAVLAAAAFEDTLRRLGSLHAGTVGGEKLAEVLTALKNSGVLQGQQVGIAQSYLTFRNHAMHAGWDKIQREAVHSVLGFVEQLVLKYFQ